MQDDVREKLEPLRSDYFDAGKDVEQLPDEKCSRVWLSVWNTKDDGTDDLLQQGANPPQYEIYWGFNGSCVHQLFPKDKPVEIPVSNLNQIYVRCSKKVASTRVFFSCFR
jgi:hypothetical protein